MGSPVDGSDFTAITGATSACQAFKSLLAVPGKLKLLLDWLISGDGDLSSEAAEGLANYLSPVGTIVMWGAASLPSDKWLVCAGQAISRTTYPVLFQRYGTVWGVGDGSTTFNLPNFQGRFPMGVDTVVPLGASGGSNSISLTDSQIPLKAHYHGVGENPGGDEIQIIERAWTKEGTYNVIQNSADNPNVTTSITDSGDLATTDPIEVVSPTTAASPVDNRPAYQALFFIIKVA